MYSIDWPAVFRPKKHAGTANPTLEDTRSSVSPVVWSLGFTSLLTDISSEMVNSILPMYLVLHLRMSPLAFGAVDGIYQGFAALLRLVAGFAGDYGQRHKAVATFGYALSAACRIGLLAAGNTWSAITAVVALDRTGKGIRTAPRDAMISLATPKTMLARAFGVHRALDAAGATLGPLCAFLILLWLPHAFDVVFVLSFSVALVGVGVIALFVHSPAAPEAPASPPTFTIRTAIDVFHGTAFRRLVIAAGFLSVATMSDAFVFLAIQQRLGFDAEVFPLLFVGVSLMNFVASAPAGRLADRVGRLHVFIAGHTLLLAVYALLLSPIAGAALAIASVALLGAYYGATDGVLAAIASATLPAERCGTGLALLATVTNMGRLVASLIFGVLWSWMSLGAATAFFAAALACAIVAAVMTFRGAAMHA